VRSGSSLHAAVRSEEPPAGEADVVAAIVLALDRGVPLREALAVRARSPHMRLALTVVRACASQGGPAAEPLDRAAAVLRSRDADLAERRAQSAQARLSALVMTVLPVAVLMLLVTTSASVRAELRTPLGLTVVLSGAALNVAGWRWMRHVIDGVAR
jgi:tight adherence protein B